jgi:hypothetical protein
LKPAAAAIGSSNSNTCPLAKCAQFGHFGVVEVSAQETWVTTSEGMGRNTARQSGANGRVYAARLAWDQPNAAWNRF